jgi:hypothetical protein
MSVTEWTWRGGAELGISRFVPRGDELRVIAAQLADHRVDGLLMIGGWAGYEAAHVLHVHREPPRPRVADRVPARVDQQRPARVRAVDRCRHRPELDRRGRGQDQAVRGRGRALLRRRGDGLRLGLPRPAQRARDRRRAGLPARGGHHPRRSPRRRRPAARRLRGGQAARADDPQRARRRPLHHALHRLAAREGGRRRCSTSGRPSSGTCSRAATRPRSTGSRRRASPRGASSSSPSRRRATPPERVHRPRGRDGCGSPPLARSPTSPRARPGDRGSRGG